MGDLENLAWAVVLEAPLPHFPIPDLVFELDGRVTFGADLTVLLDGHCEDHATWVPEYVLEAVVISEIGECRHKALTYEFEFW